MNYYELREQALMELRSEDDPGATTTRGQRAIALAILALTEQVQGLRRDLTPEQPEQIEP